MSDLVICINQIQGSDNWQHEYFTLGQSPEISQGKNNYSLSFCDWMRRWSSKLEHY